MNRKLLDKKLIRNGHFMLRTEKMCECIIDHQLGINRIELYDYDTFTEELLQIIKLKPLPYPVESLLTELSYYNKSGVRFKPLDDKFEDLLVIASVYVMIDGYAYEARYIWIHRNDGQLILDGNKGRKVFNFDELINRIEIEPKSYEKTCNNCKVLE